MDLENSNLEENPVKSESKTTNVVPNAARKYTSLDIPEMRSWSQKQFDDLYLTLEHGEVPDGPFSGAVVMPKGKDQSLVLRKLDHLGFRHLAETLWKGKHFFKDEMALRNRVSLFGQRRMFPAKLYVGESYFDSSKPAVIIDYSKFDEVQNYNRYLDFLLGSSLLNVRDEIRKINDDFYLGRAYLGQTFCLNFILFKPESLH